MCAPGADAGRAASTAVVSMVTSSAPRTPIVTVGREGSGTTSSSTVAPVRTASSPCAAACSSSIRTAAAARSASPRASRLPWAQPAAVARQASSTDHARGNVVSTIGASGRWPGGVELPGARRKQGVGDGPLACLRRSERRLAPPPAHALVAHVGDGEESTQVQLGQADGLGVVVLVLGDRPPCCLVVVVGHMADGGGDGDHRPVASVDMTGGELLDHRSQRLHRGAVAERGRHRRPEGGVVQVVTLVGAGAGIDGQTAADERRRVAGQPAGVRRDRAHVRARRVEKRLGDDDRLVGTAGHTEHVHVQARLELGHQRRDPVGAQTGDDCRGTVGVAAQRRQRGGHHPGEEAQHRLVVGGRERARRVVDSTAGAARRLACGRRRRPSPS